MINPRIHAQSVRDALGLLKQTQAGLIGAAHAVARKYPGCNRSYAVPDAIYPTLRDSPPVGAAFNLVVEYVRAYPTYPEIDDSDLC